MTINLTPETKAKWRKWALCLGLPAIIVVIALALSPFWADYERPITRAQLPAESQQFLQTYYPQGNLALARKDVEWLEKDYVVILTDGVQIEFDRRGRWKKVKDKRGLIPFDVVPPTILQYITTNYPGVAIREISRDRWEIDVKLTNRLELTFSARNFLLMDIDD